MQILKADTSVKVVIGPVVAVGDGFTPITTLVLTGGGAADEAELLKHDATAVTDISTNTFVPITSADGYYNLTLTAGQLDTEGMLTILINDDSLCLPVKQTFMVVSANVYDSLFAASGTDVLDVNVAQWLGTAAATPTVAGVPEVDITHLDGDATSLADLKDFADEGYDPGTNSLAVAVNANITALSVDAIWDEDLSTGHAVANSAAVRLSDVLVDTDELQTDWVDNGRLDLILDSRMAEASIDTTGGAVDTVTTVTTTTTNTDMRGTDNASLASALAFAQTYLDTITGADGVFLATASQPAGWPANIAASAGQIIKATVDTVTNTHTPTTTEFQADDITEATDDHYNGRIVIFTSGVLVGQATDITDYVAIGGIGQFTVTALTEAPSDDDTFIIV